MLKTPLAILVLVLASSQLSCLVASFTLGCSNNVNTAIACSALSFATAICQNANITSNSNANTTNLPCSFNSTLTTIDLSHNLLSIINDSTFASFPALRVLNLNNNYITYIAPSSFWNQTSLTILSLYQNSLTHISYLLFFTCSKLVSVDISNNKISWLPWQMFPSTLSALKTVNISFNNISFISQFSFSAPNIISLSLQSNSLLSINFTNLFAQLSSLQSLDLSSNQLTFLSGSVSSFSNNDSVFTSALPLITSLTSLYLQNNNLTTSTVSISASPQLQLNLALGNLFPNLLMLNLSSNFINSLVDLTEQFTNLTLLTYLDLSNNSIDCFFGFPICIFASTSNLSLDQQFFPFFLEFGCIYGSFEFDSTFFIANKHSPDTK